MVVVVMLLVVWGVVIQAVEYELCAAVPNFGGGEKE